MRALGDRATGSAIVFDFNTHKADGTPITLAGPPAISVYKNSTTESTAGVTLSVDYDSRTGMHHVAIDTSADGTFYATGNDFSVVITTGTVDSISVVGTVVANFSLGKANVSNMSNTALTGRDIGASVLLSSGTGTGQLSITSGVVDANAVQVSGDSAAADALESQFDGTGLTGSTYPATQAQVSAIGSGTGAALNFAAGEDNASSPIKSVSSVGSQTGTYTNTAADDGSTHVIASAANAIDWVYGFDVGAARSASKVTWKGTLTGTGGNSDTFTFQAYRFDTSAWETRYAITNTSSATQTFDITLLSRNTGTSGADKGKVYIRILFSEGDAGTVTTDLLLVQAQQSGSLVGYSDGAVWLNTAASNTNTVQYVDGVADNPVSTIAAALTIASGLGLKRIRIANGSSITLGASVAAYSLVGKNWTIALGGQAIDGTYFEGCEVSGTGTCTTQAEFCECHINAGTTVGPCKFHQCGFAGSVGSPFVAGSAGEFIFVDCWSEVSGAGTPYFTLSGASGINFRRWSGGSNITLNNAGATLTMEVVTGGGQTIACAGASVEVRGICRAVTITGITSASTCQIDAVTGPITLAGADGTVRVYGVSGVVTDSRTGSPTLVNDSVSADTVWDEATAGHSVAGTFGKLNTDIKTTTDKLDSTVVLDGSVYQFTTNALENAPSGGGGGTSDWTAGEREQIRSALGVDGTKTAATGGQLQELDTVADAIKLKTDTLPSDPADQSLVEAAITSATSTLATAANLAIVDGVVDAIKFKTDLIPATPAATGDIPSAATIADAVLDELVTDHTIPNSLGATVALSGDPLNTAVPGSYAAGTAGYQLGYMATATPGANQVTITVTESDTTPIPDVSVLIYNAGQTALLKTGTTDSNGQVVVALDDGSYRVRLDKLLVNFTVPEVLTVSGDTTDTYIGAIVVPAVDPSLQAIIINPLTLGVSYADGASIYAQSTGANLFVGGAAITKKKIYAVDMGSYFQLNVAKGAVVTVFGSSEGVVFLDKTITVTSDNSKDISTY